MPSSCGRKWRAFPSPAFSAAARRTISGRWAIPDHADRARKSITILDREAGPGEFPDNPGERFVELWNLVFMQFDRSADGKMTPLPRPSIDTGMGLERTACVLQGKLSNYETDLLRPIIDRAAELCGVTYGENDRTDVALRINADHSRATAFLIHDGVMPSNEGRGYVLRKIMRRAIRNARMIGQQDPYLYRAHRIRGGADEARVSGDDGEHPARGARGEGRRTSLRDYVSGCREDVSSRSQNAQGSVIPGDVSFKLYDTFGLALDEQEDMARQYGTGIDVRRLQCRDGKAAHARPRQLEGRGQDADQSGLPDLAAKRNSSAGRRWNPEAKFWRVAGRRNRSCSIARRSMPKPAARWAIAAYSLRRKPETPCAWIPHCTSQRPE